MSFRFASSFAAFATATVAVAVGGCNPYEATVKTRAANDLGCNDNIEVVNVGGTSYEARGCGKSATYTCSQAAEPGTLGAGDACVREAAQP